MVCARNEGDLAKLIPEMSCGVSDEVIIKFVSSVLQRNGRAMGEVN